MTLKAPKPTYLIASMGIASALLLTPGYAVSAPYHDNAAPQAYSVTSTQRANAEAATQDLITEHRLWVQSRGNGKKLGVAKLIEKAQARQQLLTELAETDPAEVLRIAIPADVAQDMPAEVQELIEQHIDLDGELEVSYRDDFTNPENSRLVHELKTNNGKRVKLHIAGDKGKLFTGSHVNAKGVVFTNTDGEESLVVNGDDDGILMLAAGGDATGGSNGGTPVSPYNTTGQQDTLVLLVNFQDNTAQPFSTSQVNNAVFGEVNSYFNENSYGQTTLAGTTKGWYTLPLSSSTCNNRDIATAAKQAATNAGVNVSAYNRFLYILPQTSACSWSGTALVGGSEAWINGTIDMDVIAHEMGHNFGLHHSHSLSCNGETIGASCQHLEYGDGVDVMGWASSSHFAPFPKEYLGWLNQSNTPGIQLITSDGTYEIEPYASQTNGTKALKVQKGFDQWGHPEYYYVEYRQPVGFDATLTSGDQNNVMNGVVIRTGVPEESSNTSFLLDMTPETYDLYTRDPALTFGRSYTDSAAGVTITAVSGDQNRAVITVSMGTQSCVRSNPTLTFSPAQGPWVAAGTAVNYNVTVTNNDGAACSNNSFNLSANVQSGWSASFNANSVSLAPGQSATTVLTVNSASPAADGFYDIAVTAASGSYSKTGNVTYVVDNPASDTNTAPVAQSDSAATTSGSSVVIPVLNNDNDADGDALTITSVSGVYGSAVINSNGTITFTPAAGYAGTEVFSYSVSDGNGGSDSANVSVSVAAVNNNSAPVAVNDSVTLSSKTAVTISVLSNDYDPENDALSIVGVTQGSKGSVSVNSNGTIYYSPSKSFKSSDSFTYTISDGQKTSTATVSISLSGSTGGNGKGNGKNR
ncbi:Ig-like domain-containing protein [Pontibacterium granulatum]|uniref:Ig-like domain-containing protein n=1 Tax=Pontibacterium granulatum TaxID=2036029 RepID=UPI00249BD8BF|nr:cadherin-like domain-containing protein [Pontibacterium granulatum]MDI3326623.1 Ig-like domain-containing protein [Pontibacterium granulatum]